MRGSGRYIGNCEAIIDYDDYGEILCEKPGVTLHQTHPGARRQPLCYFHSRLLTAPPGERAPAEEQVYKK